MTRPSRCCIFSAAQAPESRNVWPLTRIRTQPQPTEEFIIWLHHQMSPSLIRNKIFNTNKELTNCALFQSRWWSIWYGSKERTVSRISCVYEVWPVWCESKLQNTIRQSPSCPRVPTPDPAGHCLVLTDQYFCKVVAVIFIVIARCLDPTYPSFQPQTPAKSAVWSMKGTIFPMSS